MSSLETRTEKSLYEFDGFRVDPVRRRLLRGGEQVPLTPKAFSILLVLLERRGGVVDKEDLIQKVWPDTYVTEANLTQNVSSLRKALGERANDHRYVVTVPGRGYSFVAQVREVPRESTGEFQIAALFPPPGSLPAVPAPPAPPSPLPPPTAAARPALDEDETLSDTFVLSKPPPPRPFLAPRGRRRFLFAGLVLGLLLAAAMAGLYLLYGQRQKPAANAKAETPAPAAPAVNVRPTLAVMGFRNLSGIRDQDWLATALAEMLTTELSAGSRVRLVSGEDVARVRQSLKTSPGGALEDLSEDDLAQIHRSLGADQVAVGSYLSLGARGDGRIRIDLRVLKAPGGDTAASLAVSGTEDNLFELVSLLGGKMRHDLGWADPSPEQARAAQALQPGSAEAARLYAEGLDKLHAYDALGARDRLQRAVKADPDSAVIHSALSRAWTGLGYDAQGLEEARQAVSLAGSLPNEQQRAIEARFREASRDWAKATEIYRSLWTFFPDNLEYGLQLANSFSIAGRSTEALATVAALRALPAPLRDDPRIDLAAAQIARRMADPGEELRAGTAAAAKGRRLAQSQIIGEALLLQGDALYTMGRPQESIARFREARGLFAAAGNQAAVARTLNRVGAVLLDTGDFAGAEEQYQEALAIARQTGSSELVASQTLGLAFVAANLGDLERSRTLIEETHARFVALEDHLYETRTLFKIAEVLWDLGDAAGARQRYEEVLSQARQSGNRVEEARALNGIGRILTSAGPLSEARLRQEQAFAVARSYGDPFLAASYLGAVGRTLILQGDLPLAERRLTHALEEKRRVGDKLGASQLLGTLSDLAYERGDLAGAQRFASDQWELAQQIRAVLVGAAALQRQGRVQTAAGDLAGGRQRLSDALRLADERRAALLAAEIRLDLARLALLAGQAAEAERLAGEGARWYGERGLAGDQARALALLAEALQALGRPGPAGEAAGRATSLAQPSENPELQIFVTTAVAPAGVATTAAAPALDRLRGAVAEADRLGFVTAGLEARLALGSLELGTGSTAAGRATLEEVRRAAEKQGHKGLAQRAAAALAGTPRLTATPGARAAAGPAPS
ncbi:MAG TPA: tetratricopeptide repeat protein [Thermoanaerobaculia bacterium]|jgi:DNA-binding winged helix-turn-helix (wHTH) protein/TolB-like protein/Tfp pilus assembly protein PilF|nr:tetratricopeptide repeat protein [Thermoanaerobaculia bacterium]